MKIILGRRPGELAIGIVLLAFSCWACWQSYRIEGFDSLSGSGVFPLLASSVMVVSGAFILAKSIKLPRAKEEAEASAVSYLFPLKFLVFVPLMVAFAAAMPALGFFTSAALFIFVAIYFLWRKNLLTTILVTAISICAIYVIFRVLFKVVMPAGALWQ